MANDTKLDVATAPTSKLQEQATAKADLSYSYWASNTLNTPAPIVQPKALSEEEARRQQEQERKSSAIGASAWNQAGTFEERSATSWAKQRLGELLPGLSNGCVTLRQVTSVTGDANIYFVRGKKRCGFDLEVEIKWSAQLQGGKSLEGTLKVSNACSDDLDDVTVEASVTKKESEGASCACGDAKQLLPQLISKLQQLHEELKQR